MRLKEMFKLKKAGDLFNILRKPYFLERLFTIHKAL